MAEVISLMYVRAINLRRVKIGTINFVLSVNMKETRLIETQIISIDNEIVNQKLSKKSSANNAYEAINIDFTKYFDITCSLSKIKSI